MLLHRWFTPKCERGPYTEANKWIVSDPQVTFAAACLFGGDAERDAADCRFVFLDSLSPSVSPGVSVEA
jgi:hypothetical protein